MLNKTIQSISSVDFVNQAADISNNPLNRIPDNVKNDILTNANLNQLNKIFFDVHAHSFTLDNVPTNFSKILNWLTHALGNRLRKWLSAELDLPFIKNRSKEVMDELVNIYDDFFMENNISPYLFIVNLMMDMERGITGGVEKNYDKQLEELIFMKKLSHTCNTSGSSGKTYNYNQVVLPFLAVDPHNPDVFKQFISAFTPGINQTDNTFFDVDNQFFGIKIYTTLGYMPYDPTLMKIFEICEEKRIPVTTHCGSIRTRANHFKFELGDFSKPIGSQYVWRTLPSKEAFKNAFIFPKHWEKVLKRLPDLKLNFAHMGGVDELIDYVNGEVSINNVVAQIFDLMGNYNNVYTDISYSFYNFEFQQKVLELMDDERYKYKILYGSDYFLVNLERGTLNNFIQNLKNTFNNNDELWHLLTTKNPYQFLFS